MKGGKKRRERGVHLFLRLLLYLVENKRFSIKCIHYFDSRQEIKYAFEYIYIYIYISHTHTHTRTHTINVTDMQKIGYIYIYISMKYCIYFNTLTLKYDTHSKFHKSENLCGEFNSYCCLPLNILPNI
jgi:hypothetical protein